ncbi:class I SAM-dependent methyltransferase [Prosthecobacter sp.]|uniref:class I SAM-dependent methyltransferase n=1 Tax=Prosthecobacter sp. TaxID=1965333 RepID=UPI002AB8DFA0|nr:class I SAM-dependent methyltransferase [Prosthecobacter sp.]MDZ4405394.1 class I SAM-dependent methyltransferase [Prosthecobacter sp.]
MNVPTSPSPEQRFSDRVENYVRYRPRYPQEITTMLQRESGLTPQSVIADIGSGTGISAELFLRAGCTVHAVEPNREMREAAERLLSHHGGFHSVNGSAQATTLPDHSVDLIVAAQAFHWFNTPETRVEFTRILKPAGQVALIWNERKLDATPFLRAYEQLLLTFATDYTKVRHENTDAGELRCFFIGPYATHAFANEQHFDFEGLKGRLLSSSYAPAEGQSRHDEMIVELRHIFDAHQTSGQVCFEYDTRLHVGR